MQEINLLQTKIKDRNYTWERRNKLFSTICALVLILELVAGGGLFMLARLKQDNAAKVEAENSQIQSRIDAKGKDLSSGQDFQAQLKNIRTLLDRHIYWSVLFDELGKNTYAKAQYKSFQATVNGKIHVEGQAPTYTDVGKLLMSLNKSSKFSNVKLLAVQASDSEQVGYNFSLDLIPSPELFKK